MESWLGVSDMTNDEWIEWTWTEEKPYPETLGTKIYIRHRDGETDDADGAPLSVGFWRRHHNLWHHSGSIDDITHYKVAK